MLSRQIEATDGAVDKLVYELYGLTEKEIRDCGGKCEMKIYMDVCCLCRPFDDLQNRKIQLEAEAILTILDRCSRDWELIGSVVIDDEISRMTDVEKRLKVE
ncbi:MAG: hypothetical protein Q7U51_08845, partial [Methanoregula sp.]|nr:hypothetical protein [Methanoregula sp.]